MTARIIRLERSPPRQQPLPIPVWVALGTIALTLGFLGAWKALELLSGWLE